MTGSIEWKFSHFKGSPGYLKAYGDGVGRVVLIWIVLGALHFATPFHEFLAAPPLYTIILMPITSKRVDMQMQNIYLHSTHLTGLVHVYWASTRNTCVNILVTCGDHISWHQELHNSACMGKKGSLQQFPKLKFSNCFWPEEALALHYRLLVSTEHYN